MNENFMIGENLRVVRVEHGYSQSDLAKKSGISQGTISRWEAGVHTPSIRDCATLADIYGISIDDLIGRNAR